MYCIQRFAKQYRFDSQQLVICFKQFQNVKFQFLSYNLSVYRTP